MSDEERSTSVNRELASKIVAAYVRRHQLGPSLIAGVISTVHEALSRLGKAPEPIAERTPAVPVRQSVRPEYVVCLECGWKGKMLRRHLTARHELDPAAYRTQWGLPIDHALTAPEYSERRATMAKQIGLGRARGAAARATKTPAPPATVRKRGRPVRTPL